MAGRFMKIRRVVLPIMSLIILTSQLAGCATLNSQEFMETVNNVDEVVIEYNALDPGKQQAQDNQQLHVGDKAYGYEFSTEATEDPEIGLIEITEKKQELEEVTHDELIKVFQDQYDISKAIYNSDSEETILAEIDMIRGIVECMPKALPSDYEVQYRAWRPSVVAQEQNQTQDITFDEVNETVWAVGTVNIRSGPSADAEKIGQLQKGKSVTRIGIGTRKYIEWSKVQLSDGSIVYVASMYLTAIQPAPQSPSGSSSTQAPQPTQPSGEDRGTISLPSNIKIQTKEDVATGTDNPFAGYGEVNIGYGN